MLGIRGVVGEDLRGQTGWRAPHSIATAMVAVALEDLSRGRPCPKLYEPSAFKTNLKNDRDQGVLAAVRRLACRGRPASTRAANSVKVPEGPTFTPANAGPM